jgi:hypothetical protein
MKNSTNHTDLCCGPQPTIAKTSTKQYQRLFLTTIEGSIFSVVFFSFFSYLSVLDGLPIHPPPFDDDN